MPRVEERRQLLNELLESEKANLEKIKTIVADPIVLLTTKAPNFLHVAAMYGGSKAEKILKIFLHQPSTLFLIDQKDEKEKIFTDYLDEPTKDNIYKFIEETWNYWIEDLLNFPENAATMILEHNHQTILNLAIRFHLDAEIFARLLTIQPIRNLINKPDEIGRTIIFIAATHNLPFLEILLENGADLSIKCQGNYTLWSYIYKLKKDFPNLEKRKYFAQSCQILAPYFSQEETSSDESSEDSEADENYEYHSFIDNAQIKIASEKELEEIADMNEKLHQNKKVSFADYPPISVAFFRGVHYLKNRFSQEEHRKHRAQSQVGKTIYASAVHELTDTSPIDEDQDTALLQAESRNLRKTINALKQQKSIAPLPGSGKLRDFASPYAAFQQLYTNNYDNFHAAMQNKKPKEIFSKFKSTRNPCVSTSDLSRHGYKYGAGNKAFSKKDKRLDPSYHQVTGKPKHPYLGKVYVILMSAPELMDINPAFVLKMHADNEITISTHFSNDILTERESSFPGYIPGKFIVYERNVRVPSFQGEYKDYYQQKYGLTEKQYAFRKKRIQETQRGTAERADITNKILNDIIDHMSNQLLVWTQNAAYEQEAFLMYRDLDGGFSFAPPDLEEAKKRHNELESKANEVLEKLQELTIEDELFTSSDKEEEEETQESSDYDSRLTL